MGKMRVLTQRGDIVVSWNPKQKESTTQAKQEFERLQSDGYEFFVQTIGRKGGKGRARLREFDAEAGEIIAVPGVRHRRKEVSGPGSSKTRGAPQREKAMAGQPIATVAARF